MKPFQHDLAEVAHRLIEVLPRDKDGSIGVDAILWMLAPDAALCDQAPAEVFLKDPMRVIQIAAQRRWPSENDY